LDPADPVRNEIEFPNFHQSSKIPFAYFDFFLM